MAADSKKRYSGEARSDKEGSLSSGSEKNTLKIQVQSNYNVWLN